MIAGSIEIADALHVGRCNVLSLIVSVEGYKLVAFKGPVHVDVQLDILFLQRCDTKAYLQTVVTHSAEVGQKMVVSERWYGYGVVVEHVGGTRGIEIGC